MVKKLRDEVYIKDDIINEYNVCGYIVIVIRYIKVANIDKTY